MRPTPRRSSAQPTYAFLATYHEATLRFDAPMDVADAIVETVGRAHATGNLPGEPRAVMRNIVRDGFLDNSHLDAAKSQIILNAVIWLCLTCDARKANPEGYGFILEITDLGGPRTGFPTGSSPAS